jgi:cytochrome c-type biogenesis protein CcmH
MHKVILLFFLMLFPHLMYAEIAGFPFESEQEEERFRELSAELRCLVCQNQSLADSNATLAQDLRAELYEQVLSGHSRDEIISFMTARYGEFILYKPIFGSGTLLLWLTPFVFLISAIAFLVRFSRSAKDSASTRISEDELKEVRGLLEEEGAKS